MTLPQKVWLGFGALAAVLLLSAGAILLRLQGAGPEEVRSITGSVIILLIAGILVAGVTVLAFRDIAERRRSDTALKTSEIRYRRLFETAKDGILILDATTGRITDANPFMSELLDYPHHEFLGKELWEIGLFGDIEASKAAMRELQENRYIRYEDLPLQTRAGHRLDVEFVSNVYTEGDQAVVQCNIRDITERKRLEVALHQYTADLSEADRRMSEFLAMLAHELRNPLAPIRNAVQVLLATGGSGEAVQTFQMLERQVGQMVRLVDDLLDVSRISRGKVELRSGRVELASVVNHAVEAARSLAQCRGREVKVSLPEQPVYLDADPTRLAQVVGNLLNNACKFTDPGGRIALTVERDGEQAVIRVMDDGIGISAGQLPLIFDMFMQVDTSLERSVSGLGIGLTLVRNLVEMHGGSVEARSAGVGQGSEFVVRLPIATTAAAAAPLDPLFAAPLPAIPLRILVVDDNQDSADSLAMVMRLNGHETRTAADGLEAVEAAAAYQPDLVLLDIGLPRLNGYEAARRIREQPWGQSMVLVALTGWGQEDDRSRSAAAGFNAHMVKPLDLGVLGKLLASEFPTDLSSTGLAARRPQV